MRPLKNKPLLNLILLFLASVLTINLSSYQISRHLLRKKTSNHLSTYLQVTLEENMFSDEFGAVNDALAILSTGKKINILLTSMIDTQWYSNYKSCSVTINKIDSELISSYAPADQKLIISINRNHLIRPIELGISCQNKFSTYIFWDIIILFLFFLIYKLLPYPLKPKQRQWMNLLIEQGYKEKKAYKLCSIAPTETLQLNETQQRSFNALHAPDKRNFKSALRSIQDSRIANLTTNQVEWFILGLKKNINDIESAIKLATSADIIEIDLTAGTLTIHGTNVNMHKTPLLYYAWYASNTFSGNGWLVNPQSNIPDRKSGDELAKLMLRYSGHGKAISDLEEFGLKAKTLDQNRSKIKDEIISTLGKTLAQRYLFETKKDQLLQRMSYRIKLAPEYIKITS